MRAAGGDLLQTRAQGSGKRESKPLFLALELTQRADFAPRALYSGITFELFSKIYF